MEFQEQEGTTFRRASIVKRLAERRRTDTKNATSTQKQTAKTEWVGKKGLWKQKEPPSTMNDMWGRLKQ